jgi:hypothetical protein
MDKETRQRIVAGVLDISDLAREDLVKDAIERAIELLPKTLGARVRIDELPDEPKAALVELVTKERLFTARLTGVMGDYVVVKLSARRLDDGIVDAEMEQRGGRRFWTFHLGEQEPVKVESRSRFTEGVLVPSDDELFAQALASRLGWGSPDSGSD